MRRSLILAISVLTLTAIFEPLFAAEMETPGERAAPPSERERAAPPAERERPARPARERRPPRTAPERTQTAQTSSFTGTQAGGFGGGNVGGGAFADPICLTSFGLNNGCTGAPFSQSLTKTGGRGGAVVQWTVPVTPWIVVGVLGDLSFGNNSVTQTQNNYYSDPTSFGFVTTETIQNTVTERTSGSARLKAGFVVPLGEQLQHFCCWMPRFQLVLDKRGKRGQLHRESEWRCLGLRRGDADPRLRARGGACA